MWYSLLLASVEEGAKAGESAGQAGAHHGSGPLFHLFGLEVTSEITTMWAIMAVIIVLAFLSTRNLKRVPSGLQNAMEMVLDGLHGIYSATLGEKKAWKYLPFLGSMFLFIIIANYSGLIPGAGMLPGFTPPTSNLSVTVGLAVIVFLMTHYSGMRQNGVGGYLKHFIEPVPFLLPINVLEEFVKPLSLSLRLYGNIYGEEMVLATMLVLIPMFLPISIMGLGLIFGFIQAFIFTLLTSLYISTATSGGH